ncbi:hypothetical protein JOD43_000175 [Pullulanibacillus pueri]|uniref:YkoP-like domain-containing protein n=1 Tax=Pullulanibacillus pueri TaxID=1437324 RepID=A0A8J3EJZ5_9BACL|nr:hypothetical protein [Pullulanibacillus pueri]MBM7680016.1 hypothetical protein [Pullulanibacillus pueri]GGH73953.1 hypothetical protein GCM10007096_01700 [Pullulanibacillus pueri]
MEQHNQEQKKIHWHKKSLMRLYSLWEHLYHKMHGLKPRHERDLILFRIKEYKGEPLSLTDGTLLQEGDLILDLHFNNDLLIQTSIESKNTMHMITTLLHMMKATFKRMRSYMSEPEYEKVKALYGVSLFHRGAKQFGFDVLDLPKGGNSGFQRFYLRLLLTIMHPNGRQRLQSHSSMLSPKILAVSRTHFLENEKN